ncbi:DUF6625 family protein [Flavobacterium ponti]|uniref:DUF6625 family protein n=1 Tax=Flavobacterium ponti TaxID=665133 RepID=A0ABV9P637_9FLAO
MKSIILILPYFGKWPIWFEAHLLSIAKNPTINWLIVTDCEIPENYPKNIKFVSTTLAQLNVKVNTIVETNVPLTPRKFCDLKPAYGAIFSEYIETYDFWGFCDMDIIWGDIRNFITKEILEDYDIISSRKEAISGHFNLFKNIESLNNLYKEIPNYKTLFEAPEFKWFDEHVVTNFINKNIANKVFKYNLYWPTILLNQEKGRDSHQEYYLDKWQWQNGKMVDIHTKEEVMYLHFINWKKTMKECEVKYFGSKKEFYISYSVIHYDRHSSFEFFYNHFTNLFNGYYRKESRRTIKLKAKSIVKRIKKKLKKCLEF